MKISYNWLKSYLDEVEEPDKLAATLTALGLEVEAMESLSTIRGGLQGFVVGKVLTCEKHPNADRLHVTTVDIGSDVLPIVCGAPNVQAGQKVVVATIGTTLYAADGTTAKIKKSKLRGVESVGMICAEDEIGIGTSHDGILVLPDNATIGMPAADYFHVETDCVYEIDITPNRIDAASHVGVARDYAACKNIACRYPLVADFDHIDTPCPVTVTVENAEACPRYSGLCLSNVNVGPSPQWLQQRLKAVGLSPVNNIVDVTNFVLYETGQPLHAFDADKIDGEAIIVKTVAEGTKFTTLDDVERTLTAHDLMICNAREPMCMAGVFGGRNSGITESTKKIFIESAFFNPAWVRKTAKHHGLATDSSFHFERGADINITRFALLRAATLIEQIDAGKVASKIVDVYPNIAAPKRVDFNLCRCKALIGNDLPDDELVSIIKRLEINIVNRNGDDLQLEIPSYRYDVSREADVVEDILRIYGYDKVKTPAKLALSPGKSQGIDNERVTDNISKMLAARGFNEIMCVSMSSDRYYTTDNPALVRINNPLSNDLNVMRLSPLYGGLESIARNINRKVYDIRFFEFGRVYYADRNRPDISDIKRYHENKFLALWITGNKNPLSWNLKDNPTDYFYLKSFVDGLFVQLGLNLGKAASDIIIDNGEYAYAQTFALNNTPLLTMGSVKKSILKTFDIPQDVFYACLNWDLILKMLKFSKLTYTPVSKFPKVKRDMALLIDKSVSYKQLCDIAHKTVPENLSEISLFDVYEGKNLEPGKISYALSFILQDNDKTMTDGQIDKIMQKLTAAFQKTINAQIR